MIWREWFVFWVNLTISAMPPFRLNRCILKSSISVAEEEGVYWFLECFVVKGTIYMEIERKQEVKRWQRPVLLYGDEAFSGWKRQQRGSRWKAIIPQQREPSRWVTGKEVENQIEREGTREWEKEGPGSDCLCLVYRQGTIKWHSAPRRILFCKGLCLGERERVREREREWYFKVSLRIKMAASKILLMLVNYALCY